MNSLFTCSWQKNVSPINEQTWVDEVSSLLSEATEDQGEMDLGDASAKEPGKRGKKADPRYARLMGLGSVRELAGTMTPRYFATKVIRQLEADHPGKKIEDITDEELLSAMNLVSNLSRKLATRPDIKLTTQKKEDMPTAQEKVKKGKDAFETMTLNLDPGTKLEFQEDTPSGLGLYTVEKDGLKYRVALKEFDGKPVKVSDIKKDNIASLVVTEPSSKQTVEAPTVGDIEAPKVQREKPVADYPAEGDGDFSGPDPEDLAVGKDYEMDEDEDAEDEDCEWMDTPMKPTIIIVHKKSPQAIQKEMLESIRNKKQNKFRYERKNTLGY